MSPYLRHAFILLLTHFNMMVSISLRSQLLIIMYFSVMSACCVFCVTGLVFVTVIQKVYINSLGSIGSRQLKPVI